MQPNPAPAVPAAWPPPAFSLQSAKRLEELRHEAERERELLSVLTPDAFGAMVAQLVGLPLPALPDLPGRVHFFIHDERRWRPQQ